MSSKRNTRDGFPADAKTAAGALSEALADGWPGFEIEARFPLERVADAHEAIEGRKVAGRVIVSI
jgi:NADPH2:quinone reductase